MFAKKQAAAAQHRQGRHKVLKLIHKTGPLAALTALLLAASLSPVRAQDLLRRTSPAANQQQAQQINQNNPLANIQLPPQLASLTPQQLHQLAQLRELQLQQEAAAAAARQGRRDEAQLQSQHALAPIGLDAAGASSSGPLPTAPPGNGQATGQIPQPTNAETTPTSSSSSGAGNNERHDDGSYNESGSEMEGVAMSAGSPASQTPQGSNSNQAAAASAANEAANTVASGAAPSFEVNWNKCPQLEPSDSEKNKKTQVITKCLQSAPIPTNLTRENVEAHREQIATCALKVEGWFDETGAYRYDKAEAEIRGKRLDQAIESQVLKFHVACKDEASKKFPRDQNKLIDQVQFYQACMDYYISIVCEIEVSVDQ